MNLLLIAALLGSAIAVPLPEPEQRNTDLAALYNLPRETRPLHYDVRLYLDPDNQDYFLGNVTIRIMPSVATNQIVLHAMSMEIKSILVHRDNFEGNLYNSSDHATDDTHFLRIHLSETISPFVVYVLHIDYVGQFATNMFGIYVSNYQEANGTSARLITSQLQPTFARRAFPCYDEPALKAIFKTTIFAPAAYSVVRTNMDLVSETLQNDGWVRHEFSETLTMSSYLLAFLVSNFEYIENDVNAIYNVPFRVYSRPGTKDTAAFALDYGQKNMIALEQYTELPYAFPKIDKAAVPDFAAGAMENWGLVIYREVALLVRDGVTTTATKQNIGRIICHENMHMWFGNEVSPYSWTYTWLNEGFANFFENFATNLVLPEWRMMDQYVIAVQNVFQSDAVLSVNPMTFPVYTPSQIIGTFNAVAYQKSGSVIRMVQHFLTPEVFRQGLVIYLRNNSRKAAQPSDLYRSLQEALNNSNHTVPFQISSIMQRWTEQGGFPVVTVFRSAPTGDSLIFQQERFLTDRSLVSTNRWHIPVNVVMSTNVDFSDTKPDGWVQTSNTATALDVSGLSQAEWYIVNKQQTGYYRVNYEPENWVVLARVLNNTHEVIHVLNRAQLIDDSFNLARNGRLSYSHPMQLALYLKKEVDYIPWAAANAAFSYLDVVLSSTDIYDLYKRYLLELSEPMYNSLGFEASNNEEHVTAYHRNIILDINCRFGNSACVNTSTDLLQEVRESGRELNPDIQTVVYCNGLRGGDTNNFDFLWDMFLNTTDSSLQTILLNGLGCSSNPEKRTFYLQQIIIENSPVREQDRHTIAVSVINSGHENMEVALDFIVENFHLIQPNVQGLSGTTNILNALSRRLTSKAHAEKIDELVTRHQNIFTAAEQASVNAIRENIAASINWSDQNLAVVEDWIQDYYRDSAHTMTASLLLISFFITLFNY